MSTASLAGHRATSARVSIPAWGAWWAECILDEEVSLEGRVEVVLADLTLSGTIVSGGPSKDRASYRVVGGGGGWGKTIAAKTYANDAGVQDSLLVTDAASAAGETMGGTLPTTTRGNSWMRLEAPAHDVLELVAPRGWYVDEEGVTRIGRRAAAPLAVEATLAPIDTVRESVQLAAESIATILPGVIVEGIEAVDVLHEVGGGSGLRSTIWGEAFAGGQFEDAFLSCMLRVAPWLRYVRGPFEYRVVDQASERLTLQPVRVGLGLADIERVTVRPGVSGVRADVQLGSRVLVSFIESDPSRPVVVAFEDADGAGFAPTRLDLVGEDDTLVSYASAAGRVVRYGDKIQGIATGVDGTVMFSAPQSLSRVRA